MSSSYRSNRLGLSHWDTYTVHRGGCLELYYCNMVEWFWWDSSLISTTNWFPSVLWHCWFGHLACKYHLRNDLLCVEWDIKPYTHAPLNSQIPSGLGYPGCQIPHQRAAWDDTGNKPTIPTTGGQRLSATRGTAYSRFCHSAGMYRQGIRGYFAPPEISLQRLKLQSPTFVWL